MAPAFASFFPNRVSSVPFWASPGITANGDALFPSSPFYSSNLLPSFLVSLSLVLKIRNALHMIL
ncbi:unnamed protein product [Penicillium camemberti]|uniref:Str. FM013 n=1 Tax=Penicillium camemberti (strain FM 013) TaxID=1429867 RepID=A0A0G4PHM2_PENC3|nr:unnamed protein product [Penicillium camemberti]